MTNQPVTTSGIDKACVFCDAAPGKKCVGPSGRPTTMHRSRFTGKLPRGGKQVRR